MSLLWAAPALAAGEAAGSEGPRWSITSVSRPTNFKTFGTGQTGEDAYLVTVTNTGGAPSNGPITITDELPQGLSLDPLVQATGEDQLLANNGESGSSKMECLLSSCTYTGSVAVDDTLTLDVPVEVLQGAKDVEANVVRVSGGGAPAAAVETLTTISDEVAGFGISQGGAGTALSSLQAGAHPDLTTSIAFNTVNSGGSLAGDPKDTTDNLPPGFAGDLVDTPSCPNAVFLQEECPVGSQVGVITLSLARTGVIKGRKILPVYNLAPNPGEVAKLGFAVSNEFVFEGDVSVRGDDYGLKTTFHNADEGAAGLDQLTLTVWGVPADPIHNPLRARQTVGGNQFGIPSESAPAPFFTNPTTCAPRSLVATFSVTSWEHPNESESPEVTSMPFGPLVGCDRLSMEPSLTAEATTNTAESATGLALGMKVPQTYDNAYGLATSTLEQAIVTLPEGMTVNPSAGSGLGACSPAQYAEEGVQFAEGVGCPANSKLGTVEIVTPSLSEVVNGSVYLARPYDNPFKSLLALYIVARAPDRGVLVRVAGEVVADPVSGRLVTTFSNLPPLPFSTFTFKFRQGATSPLATPPICGSYTVQAQLTPWANLEGSPLSPAIPPFPITAGANGGACPSGGVPPLQPQMISGTEDNAAASYSPFYLRIARNDGEQELTKFSTTLPPGLTGNLTGIPFCPETAIEAARNATGLQEMAAPSCPAASEIGHSLVGAGVGSTLAWTPGKIYLAGPYNGSALSIVSVTSATVGPFDLGTVVIRFALHINPTTAQVEVDSNGSDPIPHIIDGIVVHVRDIHVYIDRHDFILNPTNCAPMSTSAKITGTGASVANAADDQSVTVANRFQAANCSSLSFKPIFKTSTSAKTSRKDGASLHVTLSYPEALQGSQANIRSVKVDLPRQLPSRLTTLQKACPDNVFDANPGGCPSASRIGTASAVTPIVPVPLSGPVYFVSHAARSFPDLVIVLQGYGITIDLRGETFISKKGITSTTFRTVPDQPVTSFQLTLPQGPYSALANNGNLCKVKGGLIMPTAMVAQNGLVVHQSTKIGVSGCPKPKAAVHRKKSARAKKR